MRSLYLVLALFAFLTGCFDSSTANTTAEPSGGVTVAAKTTCLSKTAKNSKAFIRGSADTFTVDVNGCFEVPAGQKVAARAMAEEQTIVLVNDSSLFSLTIPFSMLGDTFQMVQTDLAIRRATTGQFDSVLAIVFDRDHIKERKARMRKAFNSNSVDWSLKFYSPDTGSAFLVHFEFHKGDSTWTSELVTAEPGSSFDRNVSEYSNGSVPKVDTVDLFTDYRSIAKHKVQASSIYGIARTFVEGVESDSIMDSVWGVKSIKIRAVDSAGYSSTSYVRSYVGMIAKLTSTDYTMPMKGDGSAGDEGYIYCKTACFEGVTDTLDSLYVNGRNTYHDGLSADGHFNSNYRKDATLGYIYSAMRYPAMNLPKGFYFLY